MSKTIRRKSAPVPDYVLYDEGWYPIPYSVKRTGKDLKKELAHFHGDTTAGYGWNGSAPASFRRGLNRIQRAKDKAVICRIVQGDDIEFTPWKKDAGYHYW